MSTAPFATASRRRAFLLLLVTLSLGPAASPGAEKAERDRPTAPGIQREQVNLVLVDVVVTDRDGVPVVDLRPEDFTLFVDGRPVKIQAVDLRVTEPSATSAAAETLPTPTGPLPPTGTSEPLPPTPPPGAPVGIERVSQHRSIVIFFDGLNSERGLGVEAIRSARNFLKNGLQPTDEVMVVGLGRGFKVYQDFTPDVKVATAALDQVENDPMIRQGGQDHTFLNLEMLKELKDFEALGPRQAMAKSFASEDNRRMDRFFAVLGALTGLLRVRPGRKEVFLFSDGAPLSPEAIYITDHPTSKTADLLHLAREASSARVVLNPVSTLGIIDPLDPVVRAKTESVRTLSVLALNTGGVLTSGTNRNFDVPMRKIEEQTRATYQLSYAPQGEPDGKLHSTRVQVARKGIRIRSQEGYLWMTEEQRRQRETLSAYAAPELFRAIPVSLLVRTYMEDNGKPMVEVAMALNESSLLLRPQEGRRALHLEAGGVLRSTDGKVEKRFSRSVEAKLPRKSERGGGDLTLLARSPVPPGEYEAVAVVRDLDSGELGAARSSVKIPALASDHLAMSSLVLSRPESPARRIDLDPPGTGERLLQIPEVTPIFSADDKVIASSVIYHPRRDPSSREASVILLVSLQGPNDEHRSLLSVRRKIPGQDARVSIPIEFPLDLSGLKPGRYDLSVEAWDEVDGRGVLQKMEFIVQ